MINNRVRGVHQGFGQQRGARVLVLAVLVLAPAVATPAAFAHSGLISAQHSLAFSAAPSTDVFRGRISASASDCVAARAITLYRGSAAIATTSTDAGGSWSYAPATAEAGAYVAVAAQAVVKASGHKHTCVAATSNTVAIADADADGVIDAHDNCPTLANEAQQDLDDDTIGDACDPDVDGDGTRADGGDCDDRDPSRHPGAPELVADGIDNDCDGLADEDVVHAVDADADGYAAEDGDCNDFDPFINPGSPDVADGVDNDCDGAVDEDAHLYVDADGDGSPALADCDDTNPLIHPGAIELADGLDNDCDWLVDEDLWRYVDGDGDGYTPQQNDCDDTDPAINPAATEIRDAVDNNCDGAIDESYCWSPSTATISSETAWTQADEPAQTSCTYRFRVFADLVLFVNNGWYHGYGPAGAGDQTAFMFNGRAWKYLSSGPNCCVDTD